MDTTVTDHNIRITATSTGAKTGAIIVGTIMILRGHPVVDTNRGGGRRLLAAGRPASTA